jgi:dephospho-CoA kinase
MPKRGLISSAGSIINLQKVQKISAFEPSVPKSRILEASSVPIIGLTGGIATGKSTAAKYLATLGATILDADLYAREAVQPGSNGLDRIRSRYGPALLLADGELDRSALAEIIFQDPAERRWLESWIHPYVRDRLLEALPNLSPAPIVVMVIPLLFEARMTDLVNQIWVVYCSPEIQQQRLITRDRLTPEQAQVRMASQMPLEEKISRGDVGLNNSTTPLDLYQQIDQAWQRNFS